MAAGAGLVTALAHPAINRLQRPIDALDAAGLALFCVTGAATALTHRLGVVDAIILGAITGIGGGMLRDVLVGEIPTVLRGGLYAIPALVGAAIVVVAYHAGDHTIVFPSSASRSASCYAWPACATASDSPAPTRSRSPASPALTAATPSRTEATSKISSRPITPVANNRPRSCQRDDGHRRLVRVYRYRVSASVLVCGAVFDGISEELRGRTEILVREGLISEIGDSVDRSDGAKVIDLSERTVSPGFIDTHVHLTMDASTLAQQTLESSAAKALKGLSLAREYLSYGFTTLRDLGSVDPEFPTVDLRNAWTRGSCDGPRLVVAAHIISSSAGHGDLRTLLRVALGPAGLRARRRRRRRSGDSCGASTPTARTGSRPPTPAATSAPVTIRRADTWFDDEMDALTSTARLLGMPVAVHTGAPDACKQAIRYGVRSLEHAYLIDEEGVTATGRRRVHRADDADDPGGPRGTEGGHASLPGSWKFSRDDQRIIDTQRLSPRATPRSPSAPTAACSPSATASASSRRWSTPA